MTREELIRTVDDALGGGGYRVTLRAEFLRQVLEQLKLPVFPAKLTPELNDVIRSARANSNYRQNEILHREILKHLMPKPLTMFVFYATQINTLNQPSSPKIFRHKTWEGAEKNRLAAISLGSAFYVNITNVVEVPRDCDEVVIGS